MQPLNVNWMEQDDWKAPFDFYTPASSHLTLLALPIRGSCILFHRVTVKVNVCVKSMLLFSPRDSAQKRCGQVMNKELWVWVAPLSHSSLFRHTVVPPQCWAMCVLSFSSFQRAFATIVNRDKAFLECHSRTCSCAHWMQLQIRHEQRIQRAKATRCWRGGGRHRRLKCFSVSEMLNIHASA